MKGTYCISFLTLDVCTGFEFTHLYSLASQECADLQFRKAVEAEFASWYS